MTPNEKKDDLDLEKQLSLKYYHFKHVDDSFIKHAFPKHFSLASSMLRGLVA